MQTQDPHQNALVAYYLEGLEDLTQDEQRQTLVETLIARQQAFDVFAASTLDDDQLVVCELRFVGQDGRLRISRFAAVPDPDILWILAQRNAEEGDTVIIRQVLADGTNSEVEVLWPFSLNSAEKLTLPLENRRRSHMLREGDENVRSTQTRTIGKRTQLEYVLRVADTKRRWPKLGGGVEKQDGTVNIGVSLQTRQTIRDVVLRIRLRAKP